MNSDSTKRLLDLCIALSAERDREALLFRILDMAMDLTACDGGTLYLLENDLLHFCEMETRSQGIRKSGAAIQLPPVPLKPSHVCARAVLEKRLINVADVKQDTRFDFSGAAKYDAMTGYDTHSMLVLPMTDDRGHIIGVLQLINAYAEDGSLTAFDRSIEPMISALASQAAICLTNMHYSEQIQQLLDSLVRAMSEAIDERTPYNANHSRSMARYAAKFLDWLEQSGNPWKFTASQRRAFLLSVRLHDVGKLTIPLEVMDKETRLGKRLKDVAHRFDVMALLDRIALLEGRLSREEADLLEQERTQALALIQKVNTAGFLPDELLVKLETLRERSFTQADGSISPWITQEEFVCLSVRKGTLTAAEREIMESHVISTAKILAQVTFPEEYAQVSYWASAHHELLNGRGYPDQKAGSELPREVRLLTILDVFDALTATDRPYKPPMPVEKALAVLDSMAQEGSMDQEILALFRQSRAWEANT